MELKATKKISLHWQIMIALITGALTGWYFPSISPYVHWMGIIFLKTLKMIVGPFGIFYHSSRNGRYRAG